MLEGHPHAYSIIVSIPFIAGQWSLQLELAAPMGVWKCVSIPFIAGQWSLRKEDVTMVTIKLAFQSPSLRGSGRFAEEPDPSLLD